MPDAFISYSRRNKEFVQKLHQRFTDINRDIWVDWEDIEKAANWRDEIEKGIVDADNFIFVVSADSATSIECRNEVEKAVEFSKRVIPVALEDLKGDTYGKLHPAISSHNWLFYREGIEDFDAMFEELLKVMDTDFEHAREHSRLLARAREWQERNQARGFLLAGEELEEAERWLASSYDKNPQPTELQSQYIFASRRAVTRRQQIVTGASLVAAALTTILAVVAFWQFTVAAQNARQARSLELAGYTGNAIDNDNLDLAIKLGLEAASIDDAPSQVFETLAEAAYQPGTILRIDVSDVSTLLSNPAGDAFLVAYESADESSGEEAVDVGTLSLFSGETGSPIWTQTLSGDLTVTRAAFMGDGAGIAAVLSDGTIRFYNAETGEEGLTISAPEMAIVGTGIDEIGLLTGHDDGTIITWDIETGDEIARQTVSDSGNVRRIAFSADGNMAAIAATVATEERGTVNTLTVWDLTEEAAIASAEIENTVLSLAFTPDADALVYSVSGNVDLLVHSLNAFEANPRELEGAGDVINEVIFWPERDIVIGVSNNNLIYWWRLSTGRLLRRMVGHDDRVSAAAYLSNEERIVTASNDNTVRLWSLNHPQELGRRMVIQDDNVRTVNFTVDGAHILFGGDQGALGFLNVTNRQVNTPNHHQNALVVSSIDVNSQTGMVLTGDVTGANIAHTVLYWSTDENDPVYQFTGHQDYITDVAISADGVWAVTSDRSGILMIWNLSQ